MALNRLRYISGEPNRVSKPRASIVKRNRKTWQHFAAAMVIISNEEHQRNLYQSYEMRARLMVSAIDPETICIAACPVQASSVIDTALLPSVKMPIQHRSSSEHANSK